MADTKRYYWLKLKDDFFSSKRIKKLRKLAGGDTYTIIYLKLQLLSLQNNGYLYFSHIEESFAEEIALDIDEDVENVKVTLQYLASVGLIETKDGIQYELPFVAECIGSETDSARRSRESRERKRLLGFEKDEKMLPCNIVATSVQHDCNTVQQNCSGEKDIEKEKDIDKEVEVEVEDNAHGRVITTPPTRDEIAEYIRDKGYKTMTAERFISYYADRRLPLPVAWKQKLDSWEANDITYTKAPAKFDKWHRGIKHDDDEWDEWFRELANNSCGVSSDDG